jgi:hypothetical protein
MSKEACEWEADNAKLQLEGTGLYEEFPYGCDTLQHVAEALLACRKQRDELRDEFRAAKKYLLKQNLELMTFADSVQAERNEEKKRADYLSHKLHHARLLIQSEYERAEAAEDMCEDLAFLATKGVQSMYSDSDELFTLEQVREKYGLENL